MLLANENAISSGNYIIQNSLRFQSASSQYLTRTPASTTNQKTFTWSGWVKRGALGGNQLLFQAYNSGGNYNWFLFVNDTLYFQQNPTNTIEVQTTQVFRDPSAWYHIILAVDTTQATASNRVKFYVNGSQITALSVATYPAQNANTFVNSTVHHNIGTNEAVGPTYSNFLDGYLAEVNFIDGQALTPSSFGTTDPTSGQWVAAKYTGTYGTNGFYLPFSNGTSTTTLGADSSGNGNNWTLTNFTRSAGVSDCWMYDVPSGNGGASGTQPSSNYATLNPLAVSGSTGTLSKSNLFSTTPSTGGGNNYGTIAIPSTGKYYFEVIPATNWNVASGMIGLSAIGITDQFWYANANSVGYLSTAFLYKSGASQGAYGATYTNGDVIGVAVDADVSTITFYKNNVSQGFTSYAVQGLFPAICDSSNSSAVTTDVNFGQRSFAYTPPSGFKALCTANLPVATIKQGNKYMDATLATGNNSTQVITNAAGFKPDMVWMKIRSAVENHILYDSVRGATNYLVPNLTAAEGALATGLTSFNSNGFTLGNANPNYAGSPTFVAWQWQAGQGSTSSNTNGSITSTVSVNATAGFSVVTYTGTGANATVGHGLGVAPKMIIQKNRASGAANWLVYHASSSANGGFQLNLTDAYAASASYWNNTAPTSSVFSIGTFASPAANCVAYCFAEIAGFSKFGSYTGNGSADGPFVYCGFRPKFVMIKNTTTASTNWLTWDSTTNSYNVANLYLIPNSSVAEQTTGADIDVLSNGFKVRNTSGAGNTSSATIIFAAFAETPLAQSNAR